VKRELRRAWLSTILWLGLLAASGAGAERLEQSFEVAPDVHVDIEIVSGRVEVKGIAASQVRVRTRGGQLEIDADEDLVTLRAPISGLRPWTWGSTDVRIHVEVPYQSRLTVHTVNGPIDVEDVDGVLDLHAANGRIDVEGAPREAHLETLNAKIDFEGEGTEVFARTINGDIELSGVSRDVEASTMSGRIEVEGEDLERADLRTMAGDITLDASLAPGAKVYGKTYSGRVRLRLPADTSARFEIETFSGEVQSDFAASWSPPQGQRRRSVVGEGDARVAIESFSGAVRIENGEDEARERRRERREERSERRRERREERDEARAERVREEAEEQAEAEAERAEEAR
jgi:hypothetical protein